jgi:hypothetical protein
MALVGGGALGVVAFAAWWRSGAGRRLALPARVSRTHDQVLRDIGPRRRPRLQDAAASRGIPYPPPRLTLVGLKEERILEVWAADGAGWKLIVTYPILAASGGPGPKLREGDLQVPEGVYRLTGFNPNSRYHLSIRVDYPSAEDRAAAAPEGRVRLGGDIFIHGKSASIGCLAIGDDAIEELYLLLAEVGLPRTTLLLAPNASPRPVGNVPRWVTRRYEGLRMELGAVRGTVRSP